MVQFPSKLSDWNHATRSSAMVIWDVPRQRGQQDAVAILRSPLRSLSGLPELDSIALGIGYPAEAADAFHLLDSATTSAPISRNCESMASRSRTRKFTIVCWEREPK